MIQMKKPAHNKDVDNDAVKEAVSKHLPNLTAAALASALGSTYILKLTTTETGRMKYLPVEGTEEVLQAIDWIAEYGNKFGTKDEEGGGFFIIQQKAPDAKFWDALINRHLGKIPEEAKLDLTYKLDLTKIGRKAADYTIHGQKELKEPIPSSWLSE
jgi:hypothetical protein